MPEFFNFISKIESCNNNNMKNEDFKRFWEQLFMLCPHFYKWSKEKRQKECAMLKKWITHGIGHIILAPKTEKLMLMDTSDSKHTDSFIENLFLLRNMDGPNLSSESENEWETMEAALEEFDINNGPACRVVEPKNGNRQDNYIGPSTHIDDRHKFDLEKLKNIKKDTESRTSDDLVINMDRSAKMEVDHFLFGKELKTLTTVAIGKEQVEVDEADVEEQVDLTSREEEVKIKIEPRLSIGSPHYVCAEVDLTTADGDSFQNSFSHYNKSYGNNTFAESKKTSINFEGKENSVVLCTKQNTKENIIDCRSEHNKKELKTNKNESQSPINLIDEDIIDLDISDSDKISISTSWSGSDNEVNDKFKPTICSKYLDESNTRIKKPVIRQSSIMQADSKSKKTSKNSSAVEDISSVNLMVMQANNGSKNSSVINQATVATKMTKAERASDQSRKSTAIDVTTGIGNSNLNKSRSNVNNVIKRKLEETQQIKSQLLCSSAESSYQPPNKIYCSKGRNNISAHHNDVNNFDQSIPNSFYPNSNLSHHNDVNNFDQSIPNSIYPNCNLLASKEKCTNLTETTLETSLPELLPMKICKTASRDILLPEQRPVEIDKDLSKTSPSAILGTLLPEQRPVKIDKDLSKPSPFEILGTLLPEQRPMKIDKELSKTSPFAILGTLLPEQRPTPIVKTLKTNPFAILETLLPEKNPMAIVQTSATTYLNPQSEIRSPLSPRYSELYEINYCKEAPDNFFTQLFGIKCFKHLSNSVSPNAELCTKSNMLYGEVVVLKKLICLEIDQLNHAYRYMLRNMVLFEKYYPTFMRAYVLRLDVNRIIKSVDDLKYYTDTNENFLISITDGLIQCGVKEQSVTDLLMRKLMKCCLNRSPRIVGGLLNALMHVNCENTLDQFQITYIDKFKISRTVLNTILNEIKLTEKDKIICQVAKILMDD